MSTDPLWLRLPLSSASEGRSFIAGREAGWVALLVAFRLRLSTLLLLDMPFINGELTFPPTRVLVLMDGWLPIMDPALDVGRD
jgi:hypothetical protein